MREVMTSFNGHQCLINDRGRVTFNEPPFTVIPSQLKTIQLLAQGLTYDVIAKQLGKREGSLRQQMKRAMTTNGYHRAVKLVAISAELGLLRNSVLEEIAIQKELAMEQPRI